MKTLAILGGTGKEGAGLAMRWALQGYSVIRGWRSEERARTRAGEMNAELGADHLTGLENAAAAAAADIVVLSVPYSAHKATLQAVREPCQGKILVDLTVPLRPPEIMAVNLPAGGAAALEAQAPLGPAARVASEQIQDRFGGAIDYGGDDVVGGLSQGHARDSMSDKFRRAGDFASSRPVMRMPAPCTS